nr:MAG TPA: hypothetical protein [Caudoviricetes sp.]
MIKFYRLFAIQRIKEVHQHDQWVSCLYRDKGSFTVIFSCKVVS